MAKGGGVFQRFDSTGQAVWGEPGIQLSSIIVGQLSPDGNGGLVVAGMQLISDNGGDPLWRAIGQYIDSSGTPPWTSNGVVLAESVQNTGLGSPPRIRVLARADGSAVFAYARRVSANILRSYAQRVTPQGDVAFPRGGVRISGVDTSLNKPASIVGSDWSTSIVVLEDERDQGSLYAQKVDSSGGRLWRNDDVCLSSQNLSYLSGTGDGSGGIIVGGFLQSDFSLRAQQ
jgi:hypothetical protein